MTGASTARGRDAQRSCCSWRPAWCGPGARSRDLAPEATTPRTVTRVTDALDFSAPATRDDREADGAEERARAAFRRVHRLRDLDRRGRWAAVAVALALLIAPALAFGWATPDWTPAGDTALMGLRGARRRDFADAAHRAAVVDVVVRRFRRLRRPSRSGPLLPLGRGDQALRGHRHGPGLGPRDRDLRAAGSLGGVPATGCFRGLVGRRGAQHHHVHHGHGLAGRPGELANGGLPAPVRSRSALGRALRRHPAPSSRHRDRVLRGSAAPVGRPRGGAADRWRAPRLRRVARPARPLARRAGTAAVGALGRVVTRGGER